MNKYGYENFILRLENVPSLPSVGPRGLELYTWPLLVWVGMCVPVKKRERNRERKKKDPKEKWTLDQSSQQDLQYKQIFFSKNIIYYFVLV